MNFLLLLDKVHYLSTIYSLVNKILISELVGLSAFSAIFIRTTLVVKINHT
ncbi:Hypothetical protein CINCED_3A023312 [Cinara cedri]|uniref:Uncharacterized protein n=1 Tax=Cinara cedri TaxID=506608 RepID=A0A5E4M1Z9_9HEMI|nr:Hypothetical protein CINCED_3A023312 [Cinara cedri]